jgi:2-octaprenyl-6-methoxyphenol hydroxylase
LRPSLKRPTIKSDQEIRAHVTGIAAVFDVAIAGGGVAGLSLAAALKQAMGQGASVAVIDPAPAPAREGAEPPLRTVAIAEGPRRLFERLGAWEAIEPKAQAILAMDIMDGDVRDAVQLPHLHFDPRKDAEPLAHMAFNDDIVRALSDLCERLGVARLAASVARWRAGKHVAELSLSDGGAIRARLAVAADGARSKLRTLAEIPTIGWDYDQSGLVATIAHERDHEGRAEQHFLPAGPFAILPLPGRQSSIVWNERRADARALLALDAQDLVRELELRFTPKLGEIRLASRVEAFPFRFQIARRFVGERLALVGDAAHLVHPLAGQGLNLGLRDAAALAETIVGEMRLGLDPGAPAPLRSYERTRRFDIAASGMGMDAMNRLFSNDVAPLRFLRDFGLRLVDRAPLLKNLLVLEAGSAGRGAPKLLRGLALCAMI